MDSFLWNHRRVWKSPLDFTSSLLTSAPVPTLAEGQHWGRLQEQPWGQDLLSLTPLTI